MERKLRGFANKQEFLACLDARSAHGLEVFAEAKRRLPAAIEEIGFVDFGGHDYEAMNRFQTQLVGRSSEAALWGLVAVDLWFCKNFGGAHWPGLIERDSANVRFAIQTAYWVFIMSGKNCGAGLAALITRRRCWKKAEEYIRAERDKEIRGWWNRSVLPFR
ncbi:MAG: hypothetical protein L0215_19635 [Gemmataceae bacterium]|nr:hypothetical protein [Gemmataceae bacterium]